MHDTAEKWPIQSHQLMPCTHNITPLHCKMVALPPPCMCAHTPQYIPHTCLHQPTLLHSQPVHTLGQDSSGGSGARWQRRERRASKKWRICRRGLPARGRGRRTPGRRRASSTGSRRRGAARTAARPATRRRFSRPCPWTTSSAEATSSTASTTSSSCPCSPTSTGRRSRTAPATGQLRRSSWTSGTRRTCRRPARGPRRRRPRTAPLTPRGSKGYWQTGNQLRGQELGNYSTSPSLSAVSPVSRWRFQHCLLAWPSLITSGHCSQLATAISSKGLQHSPKTRSSKMLTKRHSRRRSSGYANCTTSSRSRPLAVPSVPQQHQLRPGKSSLCVKALPSDSGEAIM